MNPRHTIRNERQAATRRGISLLEVLISAFVLSVGLLGLLSLVPLGGHRVSQVNQFDRSAATGHRAFREFKTRGMLEPNRWMALSSGGTPSYIRTWTSPEGPGVLTGGVSKRNVDDWAETFCIDPLYIAKAADAGFITSSNWPGRTFPYDLLNNASYPLGFNASYPLGFGDMQNAPRMPRVTISMLENFTAINAGGPGPPGAQPMVSSVAERIFMSQNEGIYSLPNDETETPIRLYSYLGTTATIEQFQGDYSWMAMVSRSPNEVLAQFDSVSSNYFDIPPATRNEYQVSIIVFYKRNFDGGIQVASTPADELPSERTCGIQFLNGLGLGGGDVLISAGDAAKMTPSQARDYLKVAPNQWIMVCSWVPRPTTPTPTNTIYKDVYGQDRLARPIYRWYRVVATDNAPEIETIGTTDMWVRYLTLDGPDWDPSELNPVGGTGFSGTYAVLIDGVVAVFERTMQRAE